MEYRYPLKEEVVTLLHGSGAPAAGLGANGSYYIDDDAHTAYGPKTDGAWGSPFSMIGPKGEQGTLVISEVVGEFVTAPLEVDHSDTSPVYLGTAPANCIVEPIIRCTENKNGCMLTIGDEDDADSHCTDALMPVATTDPPVVSPFENQYYATAKSLIATITTAGTAGKWTVQFRITLLG